MRRAPVLAPILACLLATPACAAPVPQGAPNVPEFKPAFAGQTRAEAVTTTAKLTVTEIATGLSKPWGLALLPDGRILVSEKAPGALRIVTADGKVSPPITGTPKVDARGQGGMMGVAAPGDGWIYWTYAEPRPATAGASAGNGLAVARGKLGGSAAAPALGDVQVIFRVTPTLDSVQHYGGRLVFPADGTLFVTLGERSVLAGRAQAQRLDSHFGKIVRINRDGSLPNGNPYAATTGALPQIWSIGHRNILAGAIDARGQLWDIEHGPKGGDELNLVKPGKDYGWPTISYGEEYSGQPIPGGITQTPGMEQPVYYWDPVIAPSGMIFHSGKGFPEWKGNILTGGLASKALVRLVLSDNKVVGEERLLTDRKERIRDVIEAPDGAVWLVTDAENGKLLKVTAQ
ncbi:MAG: PQQ-dependent sugar dehydrogenase [Polymorphobacter sp.]